MKTSRKLSRRSFFLQVAGGAVGSGALALISDRAGAQTGPFTGVTDSDSGSYADNAGHGRGPGGNRSGQPGRTGITDHDPSDPAGNGRGRNTGYSDSDSGPNADPSGGGRRGRTPSSPAPSYPLRRPARRRADGTCLAPSGVTDADSGQSADPAGYGTNGGRAGNIVEPWRCPDF
jgi:hypothetical protein